VSEAEFVKFWKRLSRAQRTLLFKTDAPAKEKSMESIDMNAEDRYQALLKAENEEKLIRECSSASLNPLIAKGYLRMSGELHRPWRAHDSQKVGFIHVKGLHVRGPSEANQRRPVEHAADARSHPRCVGVSR
jgi:hypothetical protein